MNTPRLNNILTIALGGLILGIAITGGALAASGSNEISACVHHKGGGLYKARKCAKHDSRLTWNARGVRGKNGANGAVAGFSASQSLFVDFTSAGSMHPMTILTKQLPAGSFIISAKTELLGSTLSSGEYADDICRLSDGSSSDNSRWSAPVVVPGLGNYLSDGTVSMNIAVSSASPSTATLSCFNDEGSQANYAAVAKNSQIDAIQTSSNS